jgi:SpoVK/Ycf46/Vps4 family AAA+-type ATPase
MKKLKITLEDLFDFIGAKTSEINHEFKVDHDIFVRTPTKEYVPIKSVIRKTDKKIRITTSGGNTIHCGESHILMDDDLSEVYAKDADKIMFIDGVEQVVSKESTGYGLVYDISIDAPHWYVTPNGMIHHNTSFLKGMIAETGQNAMVTYHHKLLENDELFGNWYQSPENLLIIEDADTMLSSRADGNNIMDRFLNIGDGLVTMKKKKLIFSTNLPNTTSIDDALLRPGRCHDILQFSPLKFEQVKKVAAECGIDCPTDERDYSIAEIFSDVKTRKSPKKQSFGFY